ncbi:MAG: CYTH domain-containing protein [Flavobacterium sp.]|nr:MAG: CYTH domain-containing protein [Flavobacterium sp.]
MIEIERKFLVNSMAFKEEAHAKHHIAQGYLSSHPERTVRIRIKGESGFLTIKGKGNETGTTRLEWETELSLMEARPLLAICEKGTIDKIRYEVKSGKHIFEVDEFFGDNEGLIIAEIELSSEDEAFKKPEWLGEEVTNDPRYYNAYLSKKPFSGWK